MKRQRVLLTGATGLIGRQVAAPLMRLGYDVLPVSRRGAGMRGHLLDDPEAVAESAHADCLVHLAWHDGPNRMGAAENLDWLCASLRLLTAFAAAGGTRAVMVGSCAEYDWSGAGRMDETTPLRPASTYGAAKAATGLAAIAGAKALGLSLAWARPFFCYGPGEPEGRLFGDIIKGLRAGKVVDCTDGVQRRDFLHSEDLGAALAALLKSPVEGAVNIGSGQAVAVRYMIGTLARQMGREELIRLGARSRPADDPALIEADVTRLRDEVGFVPRYDMDSGIRAVLKAEGVLK
jgi:nucleoside-diphosphate-sugar epimerase